MNATKDHRRSKAQRRRGNGHPRNACDVGRARRGRDAERVRAARPAASAGGQDVPAPEARRPITLEPNVDRILDCLGVSAMSTEDPEMITLENTWIYGGYVERAQQIGAPDNRRAAERCRPAPSGTYGTLFEKKVRMSDGRSSDVEGDDNARR